MIRLAAIHVNGKPRRPLAFGDFLLLRCAVKLLTLPLEIGIHFDLGRSRSRLLKCRGKTLDFLPLVFRDLSALVLRFLQQVQFKRQPLRGDACFASRPRFKLHLLDAVVCVLDKIAVGVCGLFFVIRHIQRTARVFSGDRPRFRQFGIAKINLRPVANAFEVIADRVSALQNVAIAHQSLDFSIAALADVLKIVGVGVRDREA